MNLTIFAALCRSHGIPEPVPEYRFAAPRKWRWDFAWPSQDPPVALECDGGAWVKGRHNRGKGFINDMEKANAGVLLGWRLFRCTPQQIDSGEIFEFLRKVFVRRP